MVNFLKKKILLKEKKLTANDEKRTQFRVGKNQKP